MGVLVRGTDLVRSGSMPAVGSSGESGGVIDDGPLGARVASKASLPTISDNLASVPALTWDTTTSMGPAPTIPALALLLADGLVDGAARGGDGSCAAPSWPANTMDGSIDVLAGAVLR